MRGMDGGSAGGGRSAGVARSEEDVGPARVTRSTGVVRSTEAARSAGVARSARAWPMSAVPRLGAALVAVVALAVVVAAPLVAHHAFGAEFDRNAPIRLQGRIVRLEWVNPHTWIHLEIENEDGSSEVWAVEGGTPNVLLRRGLRRDCLQPGTEIIVDGYQAKDPSLQRANGRDVTFTDGSKIFLGSSGTGAPYDEDLLRARRERGRC